MPVRLLACTNRVSHGVLGASMAVGAYSPCEEVFQLPVRQDDILIPSKVDQELHHESMRHAVTLLQGLRHKSWREGKLWEYYNHPLRHGAIFDVSATKACEEKWMLRHTKWIHVLLSSEMFDERSVLILHGRRPLYRIHPHGDIMCSPSFTLVVAETDAGARTHTSRDRIRCTHNHGQSQSLEKISSLDVRSTGVAPPQTVWLCEPHGAHGIHTPLPQMVVIGVEMGCTVFAPTGQGSAVAIQCSDSLVECLRVLMRSLPMYSVLLCKCSSEFGD